MERERLCALAVMYSAALAKAGRLMPYRAVGKMNRGMEGKSPPLSEGKTVIVGISQAVQEAFGLCLKAGETDIPVLICGETGTGKELAARRIHEAGPRAPGPFLGVNSAALSETLLESELFGHVKGAFTGATHDRQGKFVAASGGTLFPPFSKDEQRIRYLEALQATKYPGTGRWNVSAAARQLGMPRETLTYHLKKLRISK